MKKNIETIGLAAYYKGFFWGDQGDNHMAYGPIENAYISNSEYCRKPTDMTSDPNVSGNYGDYKRLLKAVLIPIKKTIIIESYEED